MRMLYSILRRCGVAIVKELDAKRGTVSATFEKRSVPRDVIVRIVRMGGMMT